MGTNRNVANLSIAMVKTLVKMAGFGRVADMIDGGQECLNLLADIKNDALANPNAEMIRSLNGAVKSELDAIEGALRRDEISRKHIQQATAQLSDAACQTIKDLAEDDTALIRAVQQNDHFDEELKGHAAPLPDGSGDDMQAHYETLLDRIAEEFLTLAPWSPKFQPVALTTLLRCFPALSERIDRLEQHMDGRFDRIEQGMHEEHKIHIENNQILKDLSRQNATPFVGRVIFGSRPDVVAGDRFVPRHEQEQLNELIASPTQRKTVLVGMRGCGKTQLASLVAQQCEDANWNLVAWINAVSPESIKSDLVELAKEYNIKTSDIPAPKDIVKRLFNRLKSAVHSDRLIVFDNVENIDDLRGLMPSGDGLRVVATTTNNVGWEDQAWKTIRVGVFDRSESINYLLTVPKSDDHAADALAERLGDLPLAIAQAAAFAQKRKLDLVQYLERLDAYRSERVMPAVPGDYYASDVATALRVAIDDTPKELEASMSRAARCHLGVLALLAESGVPTRWLDPLIEEHHYQDPRDRDRAADDDAHDALTELLDRSIIQQSADGSTTMLHRLQAQVLRESWSEEEREQACESAAELLGSVDIDRFRADDSDARFQETRNLIEHLRAFGAQDCFHCLHDYRPVTSALCRAFTHARDLGLVPEVFALKEFVDTLLDLQVVDALDILSLRSHLAYAYLHAGHSANAIERYEKVLSSSKHALGPIDRVTLTIQNDLAYAYYWANRTDEAIDLFEQVLDERTRILSSDHEDTLMTGSYLALAYADDGQLERAITLGEQVVKDRDRVLKPDHKYTLVTRNNLADAYKSVGHLTDAIKMYEYVLQARIRTLGNTHHHTRITRNDLAQTYEQAGDLPKAISMYEDLHNDHIRIYGPDHESTIEVRDRLEAAKRQLKAQEEESPTK